MADFSKAVNDLQAARRELLARVGRIDVAISALVGVGGGARRGRPPGKRGPGRPPKSTGKRRGRRKGRKMSAATRAKMAAAQRARWAKRRAGK